MLLSGSSKTTGCTAFVLLAFFPTPQFCITLSASFPAATVLPVSGESNRTHQGPMDLLSYGQCYLITKLADSNPDTSLSAQEMNPTDPCDASQCARQRSSHRDCWTAWSYA